MPTAVTSYTLEDQERMTRAENYFAWQHRLVMRELGQRVIEIGCGIGNFTRLMLDREAVVAVDIEADCVLRLQTTLPRSGECDRHGLRCECARVCGAQDFRCGLLRVSECSGAHRARSEALRRMADVLTPGGVVILLVPAFPSLYGPIDELLGHYRRYTRASMSRLAAEAGLSVKTAFYLNAIGFFGWWTNSHILKRHAQSAAQIEFFDRYVVPIASRVENLVHPPFGQSMFIVLEKSR